MDSVGDLMPRMAEQTGAALRLTSRSGVSA